MLGNQPSVVFEVPLDKSVSPSKGHVIKRLQIKEPQSPVTLEQIEQKLQKARELRELETSKKLGQMTGERISRARERRSTFVNQQTTKIRNALDVKMEVAVKKRSQNLDQIVQKAQREIEKLGKASECRQVREQSLKTKTQEKLEKISQTQMKKEQISKDAALKAKCHTEKVLCVVQSKKEKEAQDQKAKELEFAQKLKDAQSRKEQLTKQKVQTAQMLQAKRSPSKDFSPKKEE